ncbi:MAG TPA: FAD-dependent oxidoreductase [Negativicutes bacterium]|nr:FAD-dependent oxidoreductase [Negativicutes bacterium]
MYIIIGQGAAGTHAAMELRRIDPGLPITVLTDEADSFYSRIDLPEVVAGSLSAEECKLKAQEDFQAEGIVCRPGETVTAIHLAEGFVELAGGEKLAFHRLLIASGSAPVKPPIPGIESPGVHVLWTLEQARRLADAANQSHQAIVLGAGLIGLKTALALAKRGVPVRVIECMDRILPKQLDEEAATIVTAALSAHGVEVMTNVSVKSFKQGTDGRLSCVLLSNGELPCDLAVVASGVRPNLALAKASGIEVRRGITVDACLRTSAPNVWAAGDVAEVTDLLSGEPVVPAAWPVAVSQGVAAARNMAGATMIWEPTIAMNSVEVAGMPLVSVGVLEATPTDETLTCRYGDNYRRVVLRDKKVRGILCIGDIRSAGVLTGLITRGIHCDNPEALLSPRFCIGDVMNY